MRRNALVAAALRPTDPALLHYRSGGFYLARAQQVDGHDGVGDVLLGLLASADEPIAGGRHKVFGHADLAVIPQTSTIASHLPRAMGVAFAIGRARRLGVPTRWPVDALAVCTFGDASLNHSTAQGALNAAGVHGAPGRAACRCCSCARTTGWGISVPTPAGWVEAIAGRAAGPAVRAGRRHRSGRRVRRRRGARRARAREPASRSMLHLRTVRYGGHAGTDVESAYRDPAAAMRADRAVDPLLATAAAVLVGAGLADARTSSSGGRSAAARRRASAGGRPDLRPAG